jgi:hypothetical protein
MPGRRSPARKPDPPSLGHNVNFRAPGYLVGMTARQDETGAAYAGSQLQTQVYVNRRAVLARRRRQGRVPRAGRGIY